LENSKKKKRRKCSISTGTGSKVMKGKKQRGENLGLADEEKSNHPMIIEEEKDEHRPDL